MHFRISARVRVALALATAGGVLGLTPALASAGDGLPTSVGSAHILWQNGHYNSDAKTNPDQLIYHSGAVETVPAVYVIYWGPQWQSGFSVTAGGQTYTQASAERYVNGFMGGVGGSPWAGVYAFMLYTPERGAGCGGNSVNKTNDAFGHGYIDSYSIAGSHELEEAVTDPDNYNGTQDGWNDAQTSVNGDKCAYKDLQNINLGSQYYAVQPLWSNAANGGQGGCAVHL